MDKREFKDKVYSVLSVMVKAMANPHRLEVIELLGQGERSVEEIARETNLTIANASQHLQVLKQANLVQVKRQGNYIHYRLANDNILKVWINLREVGMESLAEVDKLIKDFRAQKNSLEAISFEELITRMKSGRTILLDVRPEMEYEAGHIPDAINLPIDQLVQKVGALSKSKQYFVYCRGPFCVMADEAVQILTKKGFKVKRLKEGFPDWKAKGLPVSTLHNSL
jgi:rhodanese-related sulfurtransferase/predicted transcriptional regulator